MRKNSASINKEVTSIICLKFPENKENFSFNDINSVRSIVSLVTKNHPLEMIV